MQSYLNPVTQTWIARSIGLALLISIGLGVFNMSIASGVEVKVNDPQQTAANIVASENLLRLGAASEILLAMLSIYVAAAFYVLLKPINELLAVIMVLFRLADAALQGVAAILTSQILELAKTGDGTAAFEMQQIPDVLAHIQAAHSDAFHIALMLSSAGSAVVFYLLFRARFIPRVISAWGVIASLGVVMSNFAVRIEPSAIDIVYPWYAMANAVAFFALTLWLLVFGVNVSKWQNNTLGKQV